MSSKTPWRTLWNLNEERLLRLLGGHPGISLKNVFFQCTYMYEILQRASFMFIYVIPDIQSHLTPFRNKECPPRLLGGCAGDSKKIYFSQCSKERDILHRAFLMFIHFILGIHSYRESIQEARKSSKTPWRMLQRLLAECPPPVHIKQQISH